VLRQVVGALAVPSGTVISTVAQPPGRKRYALPSMPRHARIKAVVVREDARGRGIGAALLQRCVYWRPD
jgi:GNAT superfamily N-acetyltransferase